MNDRQILIAGGVIGAVAGVAAGYLFFTEEGRRFRASAEGSLTSLAEEAGKLLSAADQVRQSVAELRGNVQSGWPRSA